MQLPTNIFQVAENDLLQVKAKMNSMTLSRNPSGVTACILAGK